MTRLKLCAAAMFGLMVTVAAASRATETGDGPQWPDIALPDIALDEPRWPNVQIEVGVNPRPAFVDPQQVEDRILGRRPAAPQQSNVAPAPAMDDVYATGSITHWPALPPEQPPSPFAFEAGARYWYSSGSMKFGFTNGDPLFGNPTSTLDWLRLSAHSGEAFARLDHLPSGVFVKGVIGGGTVFDGRIVDKDFFVGQVKFSDTTSDVSDGNLKFAMLDVGWAYSPLPELQLGFFAGYHYWNESVPASGLVCNQASFLGCPAAGAVPVSFNTAVLKYEPTWHALRIGVAGRYTIDNRWSVNAEVTGVPYAALQNKDSHLLRQSPADLGPAPNVITDSRYAFGIEAELFVNYAVTPNIEIGGGVRYWGLTSRNGDVRFGPSFANGYFLNNFDHERFGVLLQVKGRL